SRGDRPSPRAGRDQGRGRLLPTGPRDARRRARHHALGRTAATDGAGARSSQGSADPDPRRRSLRGRQEHRGAAPADDPPGPGRAHADLDRAPDLDGAAGGSDRRVARRKDRGTRHARGADRRRRDLRRHGPPSGSGRGALERRARARPADRYSESERSELGSSWCRRFFPMSRKNRNEEAKRADAHGGHEEETLDQIKLDRRLIRRMATLVRPYRGRVVVAVALLLVSSLIDLVFPLLIKKGIDESIRPGNLDHLFFLSIVYLSLLLGNFGIRYAHLYLTQWIGQQVMHDLRVKIFRHVQTLQIAYFDRNPVGRTMTRLTS